MNTSEMGKARQQILITQTIAQGEQRARAEQARGEGAGVVNQVMTQQRSYHPRGGKRK